MSDGPGILLRGLDGSNPLAFLAALGTLRTLTLALPEEKVKMSWEQADGAWRPRLWCSLADDGDSLVGSLHEEMRQGATRASFTIGDNLNCPAVEFRSHMLNSIDHIESTASPGGRIDADFLAAFGSDVIFDDKGIMADTAMRTMSGAGHQHFLKFFRDIASRTDPHHLRRALLQQWDYADDGRGLNLRWDPIDDRRYALRWQDPSSDPVKTMRGANRLAIEALPLFPTAPVKGELSTTAFEGRGARDTFLTWPIWETCVPMDVVRSILTITASLRQQESQRIQLGIVAIYSAARITIGKFRNFTPATSV